jgi:hypothetical protein
MLCASTYTKEDRINDMNQMASAMNDIQSGFFYNNYDVVADGVVKLSEAVSRVKPPLAEVEDKDPLNRYMNQKIQMTNKIVKDIDRKSLLILQRYKEGDTAQALQAYNKIMGECIKCHREMRHW